MIVNGANCAMINLDPDSPCEIVDSDKLADQSEPLGDINQLWKWSKQIAPQFGLPKEAVLILHFMAGPVYEYIPT